MDRFTCGDPGRIRYDLTFRKICLTCDTCGFVRDLGDQPRLDDVMLAATAHNWGPAWKGPS